jgi:hypothetical protein
MRSKTSHSLPLVDGHGSVVATTGMVALIGHDTAPCVLVDKIVIVLLNIGAKAGKIDPNLCLILGYGFSSGQP